MPEEAVTVETQPDSSTGSETPAIEIPRNAEDYAKWRMDGTLPGKPKEDSTTSKEAVESEAEKPLQEKPPIGPRRAGADERLRELLADLKQAGLTPSELKTYKLEAQREAERKPESRQEPAPPQPQPKGPEAPKKPVYGDFKDWEAYEEAKDKYTEELADYKVQMAISKDRAERAQQESQKLWNQKLSEASERYGAEAEQAIVSTARAIASDQAIPGVVKAILDDSPVLTDLLYVMGSNEAALKEFVDLARTQPGLAIRKAVLLEKLVREELANGKKAAPDRAEDGKFVAGSPAKKISQAPPPPKEVASRAGPPPDESEQAWKSGNVRAYREIENRKDIARMKGQ